MRSALIAALALCMAGAAHAAPPEVRAALPQAERVGQARYQVLAWPVFEAALWAEGGRFAWTAPFALELTYLRAFSRAALVRRSLAEIAARERRPEAELEQLAPRLEACFRDVAAGDRITGVSEGPDRAVFYVNGARTCTLARPGLRRSFFGIWLDRPGAGRAFSDRLTGQQPPD